MSSPRRQGPQVAVILFLVAFVFFAIFASVAVGSVGFIFPFMFFLFFIIVIVVIAVNAASGGSSGSRIQRPITEQTAFPPPPPPDTVLVRCPYCLTNQPFQEKCVNCGGPLPKPGLY